MAPRKKRGTAVVKKKNPKDKYLTDSETDDDILQDDSPKEKDSENGKKHLHRKDSIDDFVANDAPKHPVLGDNGALEDAGQSAPAVQPDQGASPRQAEQRAKELAHLLFPEVEEANNNDNSGNQLNKASNNGKGRPHRDSVIEFEEEAETHHFHLDPEPDPTTPEEDPNRNPRKKRATKKKTTTKDQDQATPEPAPQPVLPSTSNEQPQPIEVDDEPTTPTATVEQPPTRSLGMAYIAPSQQRNMRACMVCSIVRTHNQFMQAGCPNCESFLELTGNADAVAECTSQVFDGMLTVSDTSRSWVARYQRLEGYVPGVYAIQVEGVLPEDIIVAAENAGVQYIPRDGSVSEALPTEG